MELHLKKVMTFVYLGSWINTCGKDISTRIAKAWSIHKKMDTVWKSNLSRQIKISFLKATVETVFLYGYATWTKTKSLEKRLGGTYTRLLRAALNVRWQSHTTNKVLYENLPKVSTVVKETRLRFYGHCWRIKDEIIEQLLMWQPPYGNRSRGRPAMTYVDHLVNDTALRKEDLPKAMEEREIWRRLVNSVRLRSPRYVGR